MEQIFLIDTSIVSEKIEYLLKVLEWNMIRRRRRDNKFVGISPYPENVSYRHKKETLAPDLESMSGLIWTAQKLVYYWEVRQKFMEIPQREICEDNEGHNGIRFFARVAGKDWEYNREAHSITPELALLEALYKVYVNPKT